MENKVMNIKKIFIETDDGTFDITNLGREEYEKFLELTTQLRMIYYTTLNNMQSEFPNSKTEL